MFQKSTLDVDFCSYKPLPNGMLLAQLQPPPTRRTQALLAALLSPVVANVRVDSLEVAPLAALAEQLGGGALLALCGELAKSFANRAARERADLQDEIVEGLKAEAAEIANQGLMGFFKQRVMHG